MSQCEINGISITFPYEPYNVQKDYMTKVIECLKKGVNAILESPTGTGKTLSLLCSTLAWLESRKAQQQLALIQQSVNQGEGSSVLKNLKLSLDDINGCWDSVPSLMLPKVIYSSRTHSQLSQAVQELKRSSYKHVKSVVLGSRDQLCLHPDVTKLTNHTAKVYMCRSKISSRSCPFYMNYEEKIISTVEYQETPVTDIEDLVVLGKKHKVCPYYASRYLRAKADMVFTPYNYIIDPKSRRAHGAELQGNVLIFDEAHNIESACEESVSFQLRSYDLALCITEISQTMDMIKDFDSKDFNSSDNGAPDFTLTDLSILKVMFCELEEALDKDVAECSGNGVKPGDYLIDVLSKVELTPQKKEVVLDLLDKIILYSFAGESNFLGVKGAGLQKFSDLLNVLFYQVSADGSFCTKKEFGVKYKVFLQYETQNKSHGSSDPWAAASKKKKSWRLDFWGFSPRDRMQEIVEKGVHSIILTSGTLSPLGPMIAELGIDFPVQLENPHIIKDNQVFVGVITCGPDGTPLNSSYQNRNNEAYISSLGRTICNFCRIVPDGLLVFFPSYAVLRSNQETWEDNGVWRSLCGIKPVFLEPQGKDAFQESIEKYYSAILDPSSKGATLMAVCRGKVSEGLDFADRNARGVVITGLPFPPYMDQRVKLKMEYLNSIAKAKQGIQGNDWYVLQASRAVNQAIGRVIRHKSDFGAILLCDNRFQQKHIQKQLSKWIHGCITVYDSFGPALRQLSSFFKMIDQESLRPKSDAQCIGSFVVNGSVTYSLPGQHKSTSLEMKPKENIENILESYKKDKEGLLSTCASSEPSSIFDAFEKTTDQSVNHSKASLSTSSNKTDENGYLPNSGEPKGPKRRKICIKFRTAAEEDDQKESPAEKWKKFLLEVKTLFKATDKYNVFCSAIKEYKSFKDVQKFAMTLTSIFDGVPNKEKYFQTAALLVDSKHRETFLSVCS